MRAAFVLVGACLCASTLIGAESLLIYIGTYTDTTYLGVRPNTRSQGIYAVRLDSESGKFSVPQLAAEARNSSALALHPRLPYLYATEEFMSGAVCSFAMELPSGRLHPLSRQPTDGVKPLCLETAAAGTMLIAANYGKNNEGPGSVSVLPILPDGSLGRARPAIEQRGAAGPVHPRQDFSHPHSTTLSPDGRFAFVCDLGLDRIFVYHVDRSAMALMPNDPPFASAPVGSGPRHCEFSSDGRFLYVVNELGGSVSLFDYDAQRGALRLLLTYPNLPIEFKGENNPAEIHLHSNGRFLYSCNRGSESITVFARDFQTGALNRIQVVSCGGEFPHQFALSPDGHWLICANQHSDNVTVFRVNVDTGRLEPKGTGLKIAAPSWVLIVPPQRRGGALPP